PHRGRGRQRLARLRHQGRRGPEVGGSPNRVPIVALETMIVHGKETASTTHEFLEVQFAVGNSFSCGFTQQGNDQKVFINLGSGISRANHSSKLSDLEALRTAVAGEIAKLKELGAK